MVARKMSRKIESANSDEGKKKNADLVLLGLQKPAVEQERKALVIYPNDTWKILGWDFMIAIILLITCVTTPFDLAFADETDNNDGYVFYRYCIDFLFFCDILVNFNTALQNEIFEIEDNRCVISMTYMKGWFLIDLLAIIPFEPIIKVIMSDNQKDGNNMGDYNRFVRMSRMSKLYKLIKITRLIRLVKLMKQQNNKQLKKTWSSLRISKGLEKLVFFFLMLMLLCHFVCCIWIFTAKNFEKKETDGDNWIEAGSFQDQSMGGLYLTSFYFAVTTITTVGYGDISGNSTPERLICLALHLIGVLSYSFASGSLTTIIQNYDTINDEN
jgi:hypothetical protein